MIQYLLRLFPSYRHLIEALANNLRLQDQIASVQAENSWLREQLTTAHETEREAYKMMVNAAWQIQYGMKPYPEAPGLPERLTERSEPGAIKRADHWLAMRGKGQKESMAALDRWKRQSQAAAAGQQFQDLPVEQEQVG